MSEQQIEIQEIREAGENGGDLMGYYCRGHVDRFHFAEAANHFSGAHSTYDRRHVTPEVADWIWWRTVPISGEPGMSRFVVADPHTNGAYPVTVCESVERWERHQTARIATEWRRGERNGYARGVQWCLSVLQFEHSDIADKLLAKYRKLEAQP